MTSLPTPDPLEALLASAGHDPSFPARAAGLAPADAEALLRLADAAYAAPDAERTGTKRAAELAYHALAPGFDVGTPMGVERLRRLFRSRIVPEAAEPVYRRAAGPGVADDVAVEAMLVLALVAERRRRWEEADGWRAAAEARAEDRAPEALHAVQLARLVAYGMSRREIETLLLGRALLGSLPADAWGDRRVASEAVVVALADLGDRRASAAALVEHEAIVARLEGRHRRRADAFVLERRAEAAAAAGHVEAALTLITRAAAERDPEDVRAPLYHAALRARILLDAGRPRAVHAALAPALAADPTGDPFALEARVLDACAAWDGAELGPGAAAERAVTSALDLVERPPPALLSSGVQRVLALRIVRRAAASARAEALLRRAWAVAAAAVLRRIAEIDVFVREEADPAGPAPADVAVLTGARTRLLAEHGDLLARLTPWLGAQLSALPPTIRGAPDDLVVVCAWCGRLRTPDGHWLPVQHLVPIPVDLGSKVTHAICAGCHAAMLATVHGRPTAGLADGATDAAAAP